MDILLVEYGHVITVYRGLGLSEAASRYPPGTNQSLVEAAPGVACAGDTVGEDGVVLPASPSVPPQPPAPTVVASILNLNIADGDVSAIEGSYNTGGALYLGTGLIMVFFINAMPDTNYLLVPQIGGGYTVDVAGKDTGYVMLQVKSGGVEADPACPLSAQVYTL